MREEERELLEVLDRFVRCVSVEAPFNEESVGRARDELRELVEEEGPPEEKDGWVLKLLGMYGGMGSVNDFPWSGPCEAITEELYRRLTTARGVYHGLAGGERHDPATFPELATGTRVRLLPGSTYYVDTSGTEHTVDDELSSPDDVWEIVASYGPDITGVPAYGLAHADRLVSARIVAIRKLDD